MNMDAFFQQQWAEMQAFRHDLHAHPELSFQEHRTAEKVAAKLRDWGVEVHTGLAGTGVVGVIRKSNGNTSNANESGALRAVMLRADMDALPIQEQNTFAHKSTHDGVMHACGHDGHTTMLLAAAQYLQQHAQFTGTVYVLFQPAEEDGGGAQCLLEEGLLEQFPADMVFGLHNWPDLPVGVIAVSPGAVMASSNEFAVRIEGEGGHAAMPHETVDPVLVAGHTITALQSIASRTVRPVDGVVVSVTKLQAGEVVNAIPEHCVLEGTVRTFDDAHTDVVATTMQRIVERTAQAFGARAELEFRKDYPPTINDATATEMARRAIRVMKVDAREMECREQVPTMGAEDFSYLLRERQGCYAFIGNQAVSDGASTQIQGQTPPCMLHNAHYDFNDAIIPLGAQYWVRLVEQFFEVQG